MVSVETIETSETRDESIKELRRVERWTWGKFDLSCICKESGMLHARERTREGEPITVRQGRNYRLGKPANERDAYCPRLTGHCL